MANQAVRASSSSSRGSRPPLALCPAPPRPLPEGVSDNGNRYTISQRIQALTLWAEGFSHSYIEAKTSIKERSQKNIHKRAKKRGFNKDTHPRILDSFVLNENHRGRLKIITQEIEENLITAVQTDISNRSKSSKILAYEANLSNSSALRILHKYGINYVKPTTKCGLTPAMKKAHLEFCLAHKDWTLEDWKNVIWSNETSVVLGQRRGSARFWHTPHKAYKRSIICNRWKGYSEFMFWGCFSYDHKGPCYI